MKNPLGEAQTEAKATVRKIYQKPQFIQRISDVQQVCINLYSQCIFMHAVKID